MSENSSNSISPLPSASYLSKATLNFSMAQISRPICRANSLVCRTCGRTVTSSAKQKEEYQIANSSMSMKPPESRSAARKARSANFLSNSDASERSQSATRTSVSWVICNLPSKIVPPLGISAKRWNKWAASLATCWGSPTRWDNSGTPGPDGWA